MSEATDLQIVREMFNSWNTQDLARYRKALDAECTVATHHVSDQVRGCQAACDAMREWFDVFPDLHFHIEDMIPIGKHVLTRWLTTATPQSEGMRSPSAEPQLKIHGCSVIELRNGKVVQMWSYWDSDEMVRTVSRPRRGNDDGLLRIGAASKAGSGSLSTDDGESTVDVVPEPVPRLLLLG